jgi:fatty acid desaturase
MDEYGRNMRLTIAAFIVWSWLLFGTHFMGALLSVWGMALPTAVVLGFNFKTVLMGYKADKVMESRAEAV